MNKASGPSFEDKVSHHLVLITPSETDRSQHLVEIPTRYLYEKIRDLAKMQALDAAFLLYEACLEVNHTKTTAGYLIEDFTSSSWWNMARCLHDQGSQEAKIHPLDDNRD